MTPGLAAQVLVIQGENQRAAVGSEAPEPIVVRVTDANVIPVPNQLVNWVVIAGGGTLFVSASQTNVQGESRNRWTLGTAAGEQVVEARAVDATTGEAIVFSRITATADPGPPVTLTLTQDTYEMFIGDELDMAAQITELSDAFGNPVADAPLLVEAVEPLRVQGTVLTAIGEGKVEVRVTSGEATIKTSVSILRRLIDLVGMTGSYGCTGRMGGVATSERTDFVVDSVVVPGSNGNVATVWTHGTVTTPTAVRDVPLDQFEIGVQQPGRIFVVQGSAQTQAEVTSERPLSYLGGAFCRGWRPLDSFEPFTLVAR